MVQSVVQRREARAQHGGPSGLRAGLIGANREYIEREIPHIWSLMRGDLHEVVESADVIVVGNGAREFRDLKPALDSGKVVIDLVRAFGPCGSDDKSYRGICC
jgi:GDP-mannose 6-dehydrogenase